MTCRAELGLADAIAHATDPRDTHDLLTENDQHDMRHIGRIERRRCDTARYEANV